MIYISWIILIAVVAWNYLDEQPCVTYQEPSMGWATMQDIRQAHKYHGIIASAYDGEYWFERDGQRVKLFGYKANAKANIPNHKRTRSKTR